jgi:hypothetical protein
MGEKPSKEARKGGSIAKQEGGVNFRTDNPPVTSARWPISRPHKIGN